MNKKELEFHMGMYRGLFAGSTLCEVFDELEAQIKRLCEQASVFCECPDGMSCETPEKLLRLNKCVDCWRAAAEKR